MRLALLSCLVLLACAAGASARAVGSDRCQVTAEPVVYLRPDEVRVTAGSLEVLGTFDPAAVQDTVTSKIYRLPRTRLYVIASVQYKEHYLAGRQPGLVAMRLFVSGRRREDLRAGVGYAEAEVPYASLGADPVNDSSVRTVIRLKGRSVAYVTMSCWKGGGR